MNGKKVVVYFLLAVAVTAVFLGLWIKQGYDSRPLMPIEEKK